jgi:maltooligosyltrehalose trehalohydrolase
MVAEDVKIHRRLPVGAEVLPEGGVHFRVWAPGHERAEVVYSEGQKLKIKSQKLNSPDSLELTSEAQGYFSGLLSLAGAGMLYYFRLDGKTDLYPDPASRFQPEGPLGPSQTVDPGRYTWTDKGWVGLPLDGQVIYEIHVGTFSQAGNWKGAVEQLPALAETGITVIELMPVADFAGTFNWGYDGVNLFAPSRIYGTPEDFRLFVDRAHSLRMGVILDVVYNHLGPIGNFLEQYSRHYFTSRYKNEWGDAINFDGEYSGPVREFFVANAGYWIDEFHLDGLRIDATQQIFDKSREHILTDITRKVRETAEARKTILIAENEPQETKIVHPVSQGGYGLDGLWNDDFHHSAMVALTGRNEAYYSDYLGNPQEFISSLKWGYLYQGQYYTWQQRRRGTPSLGLKPATFVLYIQNHDQIANTCCGTRLQELTSPGLLRAITALLLLAPGTPMLFQGQEFAASSHFFYFSNVSPDLAESIHQSRLKFLSQFSSLSQPETQAVIPRPEDPVTFENSKLNFAERDQHREIYQLHRDLLKLRREDPVFRAQRPGGMDGSVISQQAFILRFFGEQGDDRLIVINLGADLLLGPAPEPLLAPPEGMEWQVLWSSESLDYGGTGTPPLETKGGTSWSWRIPGRSAIVLKGEQKRNNTNTTNVK